MIATFASCAGDDCQLAFDSPPSRLSRYWDRLERQLSSYMRDRKPQGAIDPDAPSGHLSAPASPMSVLGIDTEDCDYRDDARHNGKRIARSSSAFDPAQADDGGSSLLAMLSETDSDLQWVNDTQWVLDPSLVYVVDKQRMGPDEWQSRILRDRLACVALPADKHRPIDPTAPINHPSKLGRDKLYAVACMAELSRYLRILESKFEPVPHDETIADRLAKYRPGRRTQSA